MAARPRACAATEQVPSWASTQPVCQQAVCAPQKSTAGRHLRRARQGRSWGSLCSHGIQNVPWGQQESPRQPPTTQLSEGPSSPEGSPWAPSRGERPVQGKGTRKPRVMRDASSGKPHGRHLLWALEKRDATAQVSGASGTALSRALPPQPDRPGAGGHPRPEPLLPWTLGTRILSAQITQNDRLHGQSSLCGANPGRHSVAHHELSPKGPPPVSRPSASPFPSGGTSEDSPACVS